jgi:NMD protein affecting ribosome stability and mRNA decay
LRGNWKEIRIWARRFKKALMKTTFISKEDELKEGINLYVGEGKKLLEVIKGFGLRWKTSRKLHGMREGKRLYRTTYLIRFE